MDDSTRLPAIKRFLAKPPKQATQLKLVAHAQDTHTVHTLGQWHIDDAKPELAAEVMEILSDHATELNASIQAQLQYESDAGSQVGPVKVVRCANPNVSPSGTLASSPAELTGDYTSQAAQAQRHLEAMTRLHLQSIATVITLQKQAQENLMEMCDQLAQRVVESEQRERRASTERDEAVAAAEQAAAASDDPEGAATDAAQSAIAKTLEPYMPLIIQAVMRALTPNAGPSGPTPAP